MKRTANSKIIPVVNNGESVGLSLQADCDLTIEYFIELDSVEASRAR